MLAPELSAPFPWQREAWMRLQRQIDIGRLHHGLLICGPAGIGKRAFAEHLALSLLCESRGDGSACGRCRQCTLARADTHPDFLHIQPDEAGKQIKVDQIRDLKEFVERTASMAGRKVVLIVPADAMNQNAANSLLKSLEEPAPGTYLLLVSDAPGRLAATVRSRCEQLRFGPPAREVALGWLRSLGDKESVADDETMLETCSGRPLAALELKTNAGSSAVMQRVASGLAQATRKNAVIPSVVAEWNEFDVREILHWLFVVLLDFSRGATAGCDTYWRLAANKDIYLQLASIARPVHVAQTIGNTLKALRQANSGANPNRQLLLEALIIEWQAGCECSD